MKKIIDYLVTTVDGSLRWRIPSCISAFLFLFFTGMSFIPTLYFAFVIFTLPVLGTIVQIVLLVIYFPMLTRFSAFATVLYYVDFAIFMFTDLIPLLIYIFSSKK